MQVFFPCQLAFTHVDRSDNECTFLSTCFLWILHPSLHHAPLPLGFCYTFDQQTQFLVQVICHVLPACRSCLSGEPSANLREKFITLFISQRVESTRSHSPLSPCVVPLNVEKSSWCSNDSHTMIMMVPLYFPDFLPPSFAPTFVDTTRAQARRF